MQVNEKTVSNANPALGLIVNENKVESPRVTYFMQFLPISPLVPVTSMQIT